MLIIVIYFMKLMLLDFLYIRSKIHCFSYAKLWKFGLYSVASSYVSCVKG